MTWDRVAVSPYSSLDPGEDISFAQSVGYAPIEMQYAGCATERY